MDVYKKHSHWDLLMRVLGLGMDSLVLALVLLIAYLAGLWL